MIHKVPSNRMIKCISLFLWLFLTISSLYVICIYATDFQDFNLKY